MKQALQKETAVAIRTDSREGWRLWRTIDAENQAEYVLSSRENSACAAEVMGEAISALLEGMSVALLLWDGEGEGRFGQTVMRRMGDQWPDCRLIARAEGTAFVAIADDRSHGEVIGQLLALAHHQEKAFIRVVGYRGAVAPEVRFADLFGGSFEADLELSYTNANRPMLRIRRDSAALTDCEIWSRLHACWKAATAE